MLDVEIEHRLGSFTLDIRFTTGSGLTALFGRSGAGKTSIVNAIAGLIRPQRGHIAVDGAVLLDTARGVFVPAHRRRLGYVFQEGRLFPHLTVRQNLLFGAWFAPRRANPGQAGLDEVVELLGIGPLLARRPGRLSGGEKQRVAIGRALLAQPRLLLMDEPLASLDNARKDEILPYLERLRDHSRVPFVYVSHAAAEVARLATTIVLVADGRVQAVGPAAEIMGRAGQYPLAGGFEAGAVLTATVAAHDPGWDLTRTFRRLWPAGRRPARSAGRQPVAGADPRPRRDAGDHPTERDQCAQRAARYDRGVGCDRGGSGRSAAPTWSGAFAGADYAALAGSVGARPGGRGLRGDQSRRDRPPQPRP